MILFCTINVNVYFYIFSQGCFSERGSDSCLGTEEVFCNAFGKGFVLKKTKTGSFLSVLHCDILSLLLMFL
jgi:hypothetical protein